MRSPTASTRSRAAAKSAGHPAFNPWTAEEKSYLMARYRQDLIWLYRLTDCNWLSVPQTEAA